MEENGNYCLRFRLSGGYPRITLGSRYIVYGYLGPLGKDPERKQHQKSDLWPRFWPTLGFWVRV